MPTHKQNKKAQLGEFIGRRVSALQAQAKEGTSSARAQLAQLRRGIGEPAGSDPMIWSLTLEGFPEELAGRSDGPNIYEQAAHDAITLYALHQQSKSEPMHVAGRGVGQAVRSLMMVDGAADFEKSPVLRRFNALSTSDSPSELAWHLRSLITQLRAASIPLDYSRLGRDLLDFQFEDSRNHVRLAWGRQLYGAPSKRQNTTSNTNQN